MLVVYYSLGGTTRAAATAVAGELFAEIEEIRCDRYRRGLAGFVRGVFDSVMGRVPPIGQLAHAASLYDVVVIGGPIWASRPAAPVRAYLQQAGRLPAVAFLLTHGGSPPEKALREMEQLAGSAPRATLVLREAVVKSAEFGPAVAAFAAALRPRPAA